jgi:hypothetical protein
MRSFGMSEKGISRMYEKAKTVTASKSKFDTPPRSQKALAHAVEDFYRQQFLPGGLLDVLWVKIQHRLDFALQWDNFLAQPPLPSPGDTMKLSLMDWCRAVILPSATIAIWGERLMQLEPDLMKTFIKFDNQSWKLTYKLPYLMAQEMHDTKDKIIATFERYLAVPKDQRSGAAWFIQTLEDESRRTGIADSDMAAMMVLSYWVYVVPLWLT